MEAKRVSVIIPSYNHSKFIEECIVSVFNQTYSNIEVIVIDDGSSDGSDELLRQLSFKYPFNLILKHNEGVCATLNRGIKIAKGDFITFIASDDFMPPERLEQQVSLLQNKPEIDVIAGTIAVVDDHSKILSHKSSRGLGFVTLDQMFKKNIVFAPTAMFRKETFQKFGIYNEKYVFEDYYLWLKILSNSGRIYNTSHEWAFYRLSSVNLERRFRWYYKGYQQTLGDYLEDPRARAALNHYRLVFCAKMTLLSGLRFFKSDRQEIKKLALPKRALLAFVCIAPEFLRRRLLMHLIKEL